MVSVIIWFLRIGVVVPSEVVISTCTQVPWKHPLKQDASMQTLAEQGASSKERDFQKEREKNVLAVLVFDQNMMDETPKEPDLEVCYRVFILVVSLCCNVLYFLTKIF